MLLNPPTYAAMVDASLSLHFYAWQRLIDLYTDFALNHPSSHLPGSKKYNWKEQWSDYEIAAQRDIQSILTLFQQSNELALKARLCAVSPFLLLIGQDAKFSTAASDIEFSALRTLDAVDLPGAVNALTDSPVSDKFIQAFTDLRQARNQFVHSGLSTKTERLLPQFQQMISAYRELWSDRHWLADRVAFGGSASLGFFDDGHHFSIADLVLGEWHTITRLMTGGAFKALFGVAKTKRRYVCLHCEKQARTKASNHNPKDIQTAFLETAKTLHCPMCNATYPVKRTDCLEGNCPGNVIAAKTAPDAGRCHTCLWHPSDDG